MSILYRIKIASHINGIKMGFLINEKRTMGENIEKEQLRDLFGIFLNLLFSLPLQNTIWY